MGDVRRILEFCFRARQIRLEREVHQAGQAIERLRQELTDCEERLRDQERERQEARRAPESASVTVGDLERQQLLLADYGRRIRSQEGMAAEIRTELAGTIARREGLLQDLYGIHRRQEKARLLALDEADEERQALERLDEEQLDDQYGVRFGH